MSKLQNSKAKSEHIWSNGCCDTVGRIVKCEDKKTIRRPTWLFLHRTCLPTRRSYGADRETFISSKNSAEKENHKMASIFHEVRPHPIPVSLSLSPISCMHFESIIFRRMDIFEKGFPRSDCSSSTGSADPHRCATSLAARYYSERLSKTSIPIPSKVSPNVPYEMV